MTNLQYFLKWIEDDGNFQRFGLILLILLFLLPDVIRAFFKGRQTKDNSD